MRRCHLCAFLPPERKRIKPDDKQDQSTDAAQDKERNHIPFVTCLYSVTHLLDCPVDSPVYGLVPAFIAGGLRKLYCKRARWKSCKS